MNSRWLVSVVSVGLVVGFVGAAQAAPFAVTAKARYFCCTNPNQTLGGAPVLKGGVFPDLKGVVSQMGSGPASIVVPKSQVVNIYTKGLIPDHPAVSIKTVMTTFSLANEAGTLKKGGGYGAFSFCPKAVGPGVGSCTAPSQASPPSVHGRIAVVPGPNKFGGTMRMLAGTHPKAVGGLTGFAYFFKGGSKMSQLPAAIVPFLQKLNVVGAMTPGKVFSTPQTSYYGFPGTGFMTKTVMATLYENGAGPLTTGTVLLQLTKNANPAVQSVSLMGYDKRTAMGAGNIQVVAGILMSNLNAPSTLSVIRGFRLNLPEPAPSLGLAAAAVGLLLLGLIGPRRRR